MRSLPESPDGTITSWNLAAERLYQYTAAEAVGSNVEMLVPLDGLEAHWRALRKALGGEAIEDLETVRLAKDGQRINLFLTLCPIKASSGAIIGVVSISGNATSRKFADEKCVVAVESSPSGIIVIDNAGKIVLVNREIERLFNYARSELSGQPIDILVREKLRSWHWQHPDGFGCKRELRLMGAGRELVGMRKDGSEVPVEIVLNSVQTRDGVMVVCAVVDITERKRVESLNDECVSVVSHELRTSLTSVSASLGLITGAVAIEPETTQRLIVIAHSNIQRLVRLVDDILEIKKIECAEVPFNLERVDVRSLVVQAIDSARALADAHCVSLRLRRVRRRRGARRSRQAHASDCQSALERGEILAAGQGSTGRDREPRQTCPFNREGSRSRNFRRIQVSKS